MIGVSAMLLVGLLLIIALVDAGKPKRSVAVYQHMLPEKNTWYISNGKKKVCKGGPYSTWYTTQPSSCKLAAGSYSVTCCDTRTTEGWSGGYIKIQAHKQKLCHNWQFGGSVGKCYTQKFTVAPIPTPKPTPKPTPFQPVVKCKSGGRKCPQKWGVGSAIGETFLYGSYLQVGFNKYGVFGSNKACNSRVCPWGWNQILGLRQDLDGWGSGKAPETGDFFIPGTPYYMFCVGYGSTSWCNDRTNGKPQNMRQATSIVQKSNKGKMILKVKMVFERNPIRLTAVYSFNSCSKKLKIKAIIKNIGRTTLSKPYFLVGLDPDQDQQTKGTYVTINSITGQRTKGNSFTGVCAEGQKSKVSICLSSKSKKSKAWHGTSFSQDPMKARIKIESKNYKKTADKPIALGVWSEDLRASQTTSDLGMYLGLGSAKDVAEPRNEVCS